MHKVYFILAFAMLLLWGCGWRLRPGGGERHAGDVVVERYDRIQSLYLTTGDFSALQQLNTEYPMQTRALIEDVLKIGRVNDPEINVKFLKFYQDTTPSLEHIHPQHLDEEAIDFATRCRWFKDKCAELSDEELEDEELRTAVDILRAVLYLTDEEELEKGSEAAKKSLKEKAEKYRENEHEYNQLLQVIDRHFDELADIDEKELHCISNMALVDNITNICLGNGLLNSKRAVLLRISEAYDRTKGKQGACVYMGTWKVFRKEYVPKTTDMRFWTKADRENYLKDLKRTYDEYTK